MPGPADSVFSALKANPMSGGGGSTSGASSESAAYNTRIRSAVADASPILWADFARPRSPEVAERQPATDDLRHRKAEPPARRTRTEADADHRSVASERRQGGDPVRPRHDQLPIDPCDVDAAVGDHGHEAVAHIAGCWTRRTGNGHREPPAGGIRSILRLLRKGLVCLQVSRPLSVGQCAFPSSIPTVTCFNPSLPRGARALRGANVCFVETPEMSAPGVRREKAALFQWAQGPPGNRSSRKQSEQSWR